MRSVALLVMSLLLGCTRPHARVAESLQPIDPGAGTLPQVTERFVHWRELEPEIEALVCMQTFEYEGQSLQEPIFHKRESCGLPPASTPLQLAVEDARSGAEVILAARFRELRPRLLAALEVEGEDEPLRSIRDVYLDRRAVGSLVRYLLPALEKRGLRCADCPPPYEPTRRTVGWNEFLPYFVAYIWPDPVVTPTDARGRAVGEPAYSMHICAGTNGIDEIADPDAALVELAIVTALETTVVVERAPQLFEALREESEYRQLISDEARTKWLRRELGPRLAAEPGIREALCETAARFQSDTGITIDACASKTGG